MMENELCREDWNHKKTHFPDYQENLRTAVLSICPLPKTLFLQRLFFIQRDFKNIQGRLQKIQGLSKDIMLFEGLFKACANPE